MPNTTVADQTWLTNKCPPSSLSPLSLCGTRGETGKNKNEKSHGSRQKKGDCIPISIMGKTDLTWAKIIYYQLKEPFNYLFVQWETRRQTLKEQLSSPLFLCSTSFPMPLPPTEAQGEVRLQSVPSNSSLLHFGPSWSWLCMAQESPWPLLTEATPVAPPLPNLATYTQY